MALNVQQTLYDRVWELLLARPAVAAIKPGNQITTDEEGWAEREASRVAAADHPWIALVTTGAASSKPPVTFCPIVDCEIPLSETFDIRVVYDKLSNDRTMPLEAAIEAALQASGDTLGLPWVGWFTWRRARRTTGVPGKSALRTRTTYSLTVECRPMRSELIAS